MTTSTRRTRRSGFTLSEVLMATALSTVVMAGVLSALVWVGRSGFAASSYSELETETRRALELFGEDARNAVDVAWTSNQSVTLLTIGANGVSTAVTYAYDPTPGSSTFGSFYRKAGTASVPGARRVLVRSVAPDFTFRRYKLAQEGVANNAAANDLETKQLEVAFRATRTGATVVAANQSAVSARYILRNKRVSN